ncbi:cytochrome P450 [Backusella circina FSU 941]|nr:cytochrome P450 [Backusella circina FSU 941]
MSSKDISLLQTFAIASGATIAVLSALAMKYHDRPIFYEHPKDIPFKKGYPLLGDLPGILMNFSRLLDAETDSFEHLDALTMTSGALGIPTTIFTIDPQNVEYFLKTNFKNYIKGPQFDYALRELLGDGIFNSNGEHWKYQRKTASHIFNVKNFRDHFTDVFVEEMHIVCDQLLAKSAKGRTAIDFHDVMFKFTMDSFVFLGFGVKLNSLLKDEKVPFAESFDFLQRMAVRRFIDPFLPITLATEKVFKPWKMTSEQHLKVIDKFAEDVIQKRRREIAAGETHSDLLSRFMEATNENGERLDDIELRDTVLNFIIAGRDTTAQALSWLFYNLALQPRIERKMMQEISQHITDDIEKDSPGLYEVINKMPYIHAVFFETLRLYPSVPGNQKYAIQDDIWPDGTVVKAGTYISWSSYAQGRSTKVWGHNARDFYPERWLNEDNDLVRVSQGQWPVFHVGPRVCLGQNLATLEALVSVVMMLRRYKFSLAPSQDITYDISVTMPMKYGMKVFVEERN